MCTYSVGVGIAHVEEVLHVGRVSLGCEYTLHTLCAADAHGKPYSAHEDIHVVLRGKEAVRIKCQNDANRAGTLHFVLGINDWLVVHARGIDGKGPRALGFQDNGTLQSEHVSPKFRVKFATGLTIVAPYIPGGVWISKPAMTSGKRTISRSGVFGPALLLRTGTSVEDFEPYGSLHILTAQHNVYSRAELDTHLLSSTRIKAAAGEARAVIGP